MSVSIHLAIPTLSKSRVPQVVKLVEAARGVGISAMVFANGRSAYEALVAERLSVISVGVNVGFAGGVNRAADASPPGADWLLVMNDDIEVDDFSVFLRAVEALPFADIISFGDEPLHRIPGPREVFLAVSMLGGLRRRVRASPESGPTPSDRYAPFSVVAVRMSTWKDLNGLDERYPFSFEDSDFGRRARDSGYVRQGIVGVGVRHLRGETGRANVGRVLPAAVWGGYSYLRKWGMSTTLAAALCSVALTVRLPLVVFSRSSRLDHVRGIVRAMSAVITNRKPELPEYECS